jgi:hypothetical protein
MEWWRSLTRRKRIFSSTPLTVLSMQSERRASKTVLVVHVAAGRHDVLGRAAP